MKFGKVFIIVEYVGLDDILGITCKDDDSGDYATFNTHKEAEAYAKENCAFEYAIVEL